MRKTMYLSIVKAAAFSLFLTLGMQECASAQKTHSEETLTEADAGAEETGEQITEAESEAEVETSRIRFASDMEEVFQALLKAQEPFILYEDYDVAVEESPMYKEAAEGDTGTALNARATGDASDSSGDYSTTNVREQGVDESDIVKTDGRYIYILGDDGWLIIVSAQGDRSQEVCRYKLRPENEEADLFARELYVSGDTLCVICEETLPWNYKRATGDYYMNARRTTSVIFTLDITDREDPSLRGQVRQEGGFCQSRKTGDIVWLYTSLYPQVSDTLEGSDIGVTVNGEELQPSDFCIPECVTSASYLVASSVGVTDPDRVLDAKVLLSGADTFYVTEKSLYVVNEDYGSYRSRSEIVRFSLADGKMEGIGAARVLGILNDSFSLDEYDGVLRVLTTYTGSDGGEILEKISDLFGWYYYPNDRWVRHNAIYLLDESMNEISSLKGIAKNEDIRSARFFGDTAYFVTYENTDPLFTADLSDPEHPALAGELKVTGFSSYLHPYGDGKLLGIGYETDPDTGITQGLKLSMFDISDPLHVTEIDRLVIPGIFNAPAIENYKSILADAGKNLIGFYVEDRYQVYSYEEGKGFVRRLHYDLFEDALNGTVTESDVRGIYSGDEFYLAGRRFLINFEMEDDEFDKELTLKFSY